MLKRHVLLAQCVLPVLDKTNNTSSRVNRCRFDGLQFAHIPDNIRRTGMRDVESELGL